jgi:hypothetical protein
MAPNEAFHRIANAPGELYDRTNRHMAAEKFISTPKLLEYLKKKIAEHLISHEVYDIGHYGWLDEDTPDPQFLGHAMWQVEPPLQHEHHSAFGEAPVRHRPSEEEEVLAVSGSDFEGLMRLSRMSLGLSLWNQQFDEPAMFEDNDHFWLHYLSTMVMLNAASDRLREFFVMAFFRMKTDAYDRKKGACFGNKYNWYQTPFIEAKDSANSSIAVQLEGLAILAEEIFRHRKTRNTMVHEIATKVGERERKLTRLQRDRFDEQQISGFVPQVPKFEETKQRFTQAQDSHKAEIRQTMDDVVSWYKTLVQASSYAFEVENRIRRQ